ncbi:T6SS immunity protein Tli4 family protein [Massilia sp. LXY-6]|uniref:T6SS immunity protein Tli4 family protein n=1 Tax=Massilia sp. LXY-6 TaxID=3379823 RepID=UPI003EE29F0F
MGFFRRLYLISLTAVLLIMTACDYNRKEGETLNMIALTPRLQVVFEKTKTVCFGRFLIDLPESATVAWGNASIPLGVIIYPNGADQVHQLAKKFADELKGEKAINHNDVPLLISEEDVAQPQGKIITGYEDFDAVNGLKINGYFKLNNDGVIISSRPLQANKNKAIAGINSIARRLRPRGENEIPSEPGNCIEYAFLAEQPDTDALPPMEHIRIGFRLKEFPDTHLSILLGPSNPHHSEGNSLEWQLERLEKDLAQDPNQPQLKTKYLRRGTRQIHDWVNGFEALSHTPEQAEVHGIHDFAMDFKGVPSDPLKPYADIRMQTGVANNAAGATKPSLTDEEAIAVWDKITSTIRVRPTSATPLKTAGSAPRPQLPIGELAATGRTCPQTGWWQPDEPQSIEGSRRQHFKTGERMPHVVTLGPPSLWQKLKGEKPSYRTATVWKLVAYGDARIADTARNDSPPNETPPEKKG